MSREREAARALLSNRNLISGKQSLDLSHVRIMGILNVTPDSFYDGGQYLALDRARAQADHLVEAGAAIIDVGGISTRPGSKPISVQQELDRLMPILEYLCRLPIWISVDTYRAPIMTEAIRLGVQMINDVCALQEAKTLKVLAGSTASVCLMHQKGTLHTTQEAPPDTGDVIHDVLEFLRARSGACMASGIERARIVVDPGFGFGKGHRHNFKLLANLNVLKTLGFPIMVGLSRKSMLRSLLPCVQESLMLSSTVAAHMIAMVHGARVLRVHDVLEAVTAVKIYEAMCAAQES